MNQVAQTPLSREAVSMLIEELWRTQHRVAEESHSRPVPMESRIISEETIDPDSVTGPQRQLLEAYSKHIQYAAHVTYQRYGRTGKATLLRLRDDFTPQEVFGLTDNLLPYCSLEFYDEEVYFNIGPIKSCKIKYLELCGGKYIELGMGDLGVLASYAFLAYHTGTKKPLTEALVGLIQRLLPYTPGEVRLAGYDETVKYCINTVACNDPRIMRRHILLAGPPGCGKSMILKRVAEAFPGYIRCSLARTDDWLGWLRLFSAALLGSGRRMLVLIDEIDELGLTRERDGGSVFELLRIMDGLDDNRNMVLLASTNRLKDLDEALLRPGRFGPVMHVLRPDAHQIEQIVGFYAEMYGVDLGGDSSASVGCLSGADIRAAFEDCIIQGQPLTRACVSNNLSSVASQRVKGGVVGV